MRRQLCRLVAVLGVNLLLITGAALTFPEDRHRDEIRAGPATAVHHSPRYGLHVCREPWEGLHANANAASLLRLAAGVGRPRCRRCG